MAESSAVRCRDCNYRAKVPPPARCPSCKARYPWTAEPLTRQLELFGKTGPRRRPAQQEGR